MNNKFYSNNRTHNDKMYIPKRNRFEFDRVVSLKCFGEVLSEGKSKLWKILVSVGTFLNAFSNDKPINVI